MSLPFFILALVVVMFQAKRNSLYWQNALGKMPDMWGLSVFVLPKREIRQIFALSLARSLIVLAVQVKSPSMEQEESLDNDGI